MTFTKIIQLSDLHLVAPGRPLFGAVPGCQETPGFSVALIDETSVVVHHQTFPDVDRFPI